MDSMKQYILPFLSATIVAVGIAGAGYFVNCGLRAAYSDNRSVSVKGLSERDVRADLAVWRISFETESESLPQARSENIDREKKIREFLLAQKINPESINVESITASKSREENGEDERGATLYKQVYSVEEILVVRSTAIDDVSQATQKTADLIDQGIVLSRSDVKYIFTKLNEIKPDMIAEATKNARAAADQFARDSGSEVGGITSATQGWFNILPRDGSSDYGEENFIDKRVRVVADVNFRLKD